MVTDPGPREDKKLEADRDDSLDSDNLVSEVEGFDTPRDAIEFTDPESDDYVTLGIGPDDEDDSDEEEGFDTEDIVEKGEDPDQ